MYACVNVLKFYAVVQKMAKHRRRYFLPHPVELRNAKNMYEATEMN